MEKREKSVEVQSGSEKIIPVEEEFNSPPVYLVKSNVRLFLFSGACIASGSLLLIISSWFPQVFSFLARKRLPEYTPKCNANFVLIKDADAIYTEAKMEETTLSNGQKEIFFVYKKRRYFYDSVQDAFAMRHLKLSKPIQDLFAIMDKGGLNQEEWKDLVAINGFNEVDIPNKSIPLMILHKIAWFSVFIWLAQNYTTFAIVIAILSTVSFLWEVFTAKRNERQLRSLVKIEKEVHVLRGGHIFPVNATQLVPGDICSIQRGDLVVADMALISGEAVLDESSLTGESHPIPKHAFRKGELDHEIYKPEYFRPNSLYSGSTIVEAKQSTVNSSIYNEKSHCLAVVTATGFSTSKGELFRTILYPEKLDIRLNKDANYFLIMLIVFATLSFGFRILNGVTFHQSIDFILLYSFDLVTIAIPPALPLVLTIGIGFALRRLKKKDIFNIDPQRVNFAGKVNVMALDKTGTLTEDRLYFHSIVSVDNSKVTFNEQQVKIHPGTLMERILVTCHSLSKVGDTLVGNSVDKNMFKETKWSILESSSFHSDYPSFIAMLSPPPGHQSPGIGILKRFDFDPQVARTSVIFRDEKSTDTFAVCKGSGDSIYRICKQETIPKNYKDLLRDFSSQGYYVIACCYKQLACESGKDSEFKALKRSQVESYGFHFAGFLLLSNPLKPDAKCTVKSLMEANVGVVMITGDSIYTAISVAKELGFVNSVLIIDKPHKAEDESNEEELLNKPNGGLYYHIFQDNDHSWKPFEESNELIYNYDLAITGAAVNEISQRSPLDKFSSYLIRSAKIFARAKPVQKSWILREHIKHGAYVGMCGDGMNDCGALKTAHVGIALSNTDASIVAPFTSKKKQVYDIVEVLREGRCALETSFVAFKYMILYPVIQTINQATLTYQNTRLSNNQFILEDMFYVLGLSLAMLYTTPKSRMGRHHVVDSLFDPVILASILGQIFIMVVHFAIAMVLLNSQSWYCTISQLNAFNNVPGYNNYTVSTTRPDEKCFLFPTDATVIDTYGYENNTVFLFSSLQYVIVAMAFNFFNQFRTKVYKNLYFCFYCLLSIIVGIWFILSPSNILPFNIIRNGVPSLFFQQLVYILICNTVFSLSWEYFIVNRVIPKCQKRWKKQSTKEMKLDQSSQESLISKKEESHMLVPVDENEKLRT